MCYNICKSLFNVLRARSMKVQHPKPLSSLVVYEANLI